MWAGLAIALAGGARTGVAKQAEPVTNLVAALDAAKAGNKLLFVQYGREACGNCQALKGLIRRGQLKLRDTEFVYADVCCDDPATRKAFNDQFKIEGTALPFVIIAAPDGKQLASRSGYGEANEFDRLIDTAEKKFKEEGGPPGAVGGAAPAAGPSRLPMPRPILPDENREVRTWTSRSGSSLEASLVEVTAPYVVLKKADGSKMKILQANLSGGDQAYIEGLRAAPAAP